MTWIEAFHKGRVRWLTWIAIGSVLACGFLIKGGTRSELLWAILIGAANGTAVGFALGPAAEKGAMILSGLFAGTPFYLIGSSIFVIELIEARKLHRGLLSDVIPIVSAFLAVGILFSFGQALRVRSRPCQRIPNQAMRGKWLKVSVIVAMLAVASGSLWFAHHARDQRKKAEREAGYQAALAQYADLKPGMKRERVEGYFQTNGMRFRQMCCVANFKGEFVALRGAAWDDLVKIAEERAPWVCNENNVYIAFEFNPKSQGETSETNGTDILKRVSIFHQLEGCL